MRAQVYGIATACVIALAGAVPARADTQLIIDFDNLSIGTGQFSVDAFGDPNFTNTIFGGTVGAATLADPAVSGTQLYRGTSIGFRLSDPFNYSWPAVGAFVTGTGPITLTLKSYDADLGEEVAVFTSSINGGVSVYLGGGSSTTPGFYTSALFESASTFSLDDLTLGLVDVPPGIPEPATWAMMIGGFGITGGAMRHRRGTITVRFG